MYAAALPCLGRYLLDGVSGPFAFEQGAKPLRFLERMHVGPMNVFDDLRFERFRVGEDNDADGNFLQARPLRGAITPRSRNDFEVAVHSPREQRREDAFAADALGQFLQSLLIERLARVGRGFDQLREGNVHVLLQRFHCFFRVHFFSPFFEFSKCLILFRQKNRGDGAVGFGDDVELHVGKGSIAAQEPESPFQAELVFSAVLLAQVAPIAVNVAREEVLRSLACFFESGQRAGCGDDLAE